jgi:hypothetical protein
MILAKALLYKRLQIDLELGALGSNQRLELAECQESDPSIGRLSPMKGDKAEFEAATKALCEVELISGGSEKEAAWKQPEPLLSGLYVNQCEDGALGQSNGAPDSLTATNTDHVERPGPTVGKAESFEGGLSSC